MSISGKEINSGQGGEDCYQQADRCHELESSHSNWG